MMMMIISHLNFVSVAQMTHSEINLSLEAIKLGGHCYFEEKVKKISFECSVEINCSIFSEYLYFDISLTL